MLLTCALYPCMRVLAFAYPNGKDYPDLGCRSNSLAAAGYANFDYDVAPWVDQSLLLWKPPSSCCFL